MATLLYRLFRLPRHLKRLIQFFIDANLLTLSFVMAIWLRLENISPLLEPTTWLMWFAVLASSLVIFAKLGFYRAVIRYLSTKTLRVLLIGNSISAALLIIYAGLFSISLPLTACLIYPMLAFLSIGGVRYCLRSLNIHSMIRYKARVIIYGAGTAGSQLVNTLRQGFEYAPVAFVDDWRGMHGTYVEGLQVYDPKTLPRLLKHHGAQRILLAMPSASRSRRREILQTLEPLSVPVQTLPSMEDMIAGRARLNEIRDVSVEDLLGRDPVPPNQELLDANVRGKVVMVTGAGGSIGSELCHQLIKQGPRLLLLFENSEFALYSVERALQQRMQAQSVDVTVRALLGSVQDRHRLDSVMRAFGVQTIYHAAAYKHVPLVEYNTTQGILNNVFGTLATAQAAVACKVETFVLVSTDKAVRPTNVMGTTKRLAELICQALAEQQIQTRFSMVRFGNVLGSSGSVVPLFREQIANGGPITLTHPEVTRYFMTIPEAAQLVIQAGAMGSGGDVFVLDMGKPVRIADLAAKMIRLSGLEVRSEQNPGGDIEILHTGLRPGEKLYEELLVSDNEAPTAHPRIKTAREHFWPWTRLEPYLEQLLQSVKKQQHVKIRELLMAAPTSYVPQGDIVDLVEIGRTPTTTRQQTLDFPIAAESATARTSVPLDAAPGPYLAPSTHKG